MTENFYRLFVRCWRELEVGPICDLRRMKCDGCGARVPLPFEMTCYAASKNFCHLTASKFRRQCRGMMQVDLPGITQCSAPVMRNHRVYIPDVWALGILPGASPMHAVNFYWRDCPRMIPRLLDMDGVPVSNTMAKRRDIMTSLLQGGEPGVSDPKVDLSPRALRERIRVHLEANLCH